jgi:hypothetical protein
MLIDQATAKVDRQGSVFFEGHDAKALALFEFNLGAIALLAAFAPTEHMWIWLAEIPFAISGALFLRALALKGFSLGPQLEAFQDEHASKPAAQTQEAMLSELYTVLATNTARAAAKGRAVKQGFGVLILAVMIGALLVIEARLQ